MGNVYTDTNSAISRYRLTINADNFGLLSSYFNDYPLLGHKALQLQVWLKLVDCILKHRNKTKIDQNLINELVLELSKLK